jgi:hypothetical protein
LKSEGNLLRESVQGREAPGAGRKAVHIDLEQVEKLCGLQCTDDELASFFGVSARTIERRKNQTAFAEAVARGKAKGRLSLRRYLWGLAAKGNSAANIFLAKNLLGYKDYFASELSGPDGGARPNVRAKVERELATRSLREFVRQAWHVVEPATVFVSGWHIDAIVEHLEAVSRGEIPNLLINVPPRHMKSLLVSVFWPAWEWTRWPERRWLYSSYAATLSIRYSVNCRRLIESPWYQARWGHVFRLTGDQNAKTRFDNNRSGYRLSTSVGGSATGEGGDRIVCDDPHKVDEVESDAVRKGTIGWYDVVMSTRLNDPKTSAMEVVMQRCHQQDLSGHLLEKCNWEHRCLPAEYEGRSRATSIVFVDQRQYPGELGRPLWQERDRTAQNKPGQLCRRWTASTAVLAAGRRSH